MYMEVKNTCNTNKRQELLTFREQLVSSGFWWRLWCSSLLAVACCVLFVFFPCLVCRMLPVVLDCPFLIALPFSLTFIQENRITISFLLLVGFSNISISVPTHRLLKG